MTASLQDLNLNSILFSDSVAGVTDFCRCCHLRTHGLLWLVSWCAYLIRAFICGAMAADILDGTGLLLLDTDAVCSFETDLMAPGVALFRPNRNESIFDDMAAIMYRIECKKKKGYGQDCIYNRRKEK